MFIPSEQTPFLVLLNTAIIVCIYLLMRKAIIFNKPVSKGKFRLVIVLCSIFMLYSVWGSDWFHYLEAFDEIKNGYQNSLEEIYYWIINELCSSYITFRVIVWLSAFFFLLQGIRRLNLDRNVALFVFGTCWLALFSYARVSLAFAIMFYGLAFFYRPFFNKVFISRIIAIAIISSSIFFHKSAAFGICCIALCLFFAKIGKRGIIFVLACFPIIAIVAKFYVAQYLLIDFDIEGDMMNSYSSVGQRYMLRNVTETGVAAIIHRTLERLPHYLLVIQSIVFIRNKKYSAFPTDIQAFIRVQMIIVILASIFAIDLGVNTSIVYIRFLRFAIIPSTIVLAYYYQHYRNMKLTKYTFTIAFLSAIYSTLYSAYCLIVK